ARTRRRLSGSSRSPSAVEPVTSEKTTVTVFRCSIERASAGSEAPQALQNLAPAGFSWLQLGHTCTSQRLERRERVHNGGRQPGLATGERVRRVRARSHAGASGYMPSAFAAFDLSDGVMESSTASRAAT